MYELIDFKRENLNAMPSIHTEKEGECDDEFVVVISELRWQEHEEVELLHKSQPVRDCLQKLVCGT